ncbi:MAG TPA: hypothetical protein EYO71_01070 [Rhodospirillales bacterium]|nr:hypothetical protein [Rhodospirillales bacterium]
MIRTVLLGLSATILLTSSVFARTFSIGTNPQGSLAYSTGAGIAKVANEVAGIKARVVPQGGGLSLLSHWSIKVSWIFRFRSACSQY